MERVLAGHGLGLTEFQIMVSLYESPRSALGLTRRLRLDPAPVSRALARLRERGIVTRASNRRLASWSLTSSGRNELEVLDLVWPGLDAETRETLGPEVANRVIALVDRLPKTLPPERPGWSDD
jgi:DNA-binding MarR family transcriptional regulator